MSSTNTGVGSGRRMRAVMSGWMVGVATAAGVGVMLGAGAWERGAETPVALVGERSVGMSELWPQLAEAAGGQVLEEFSVNLLVKEACSKRGVSVSKAMIQAEREALGRMLATSAGVPASESESLIERVRQTRSLGERRFAALLERNAGLRALVRADEPVTITPEDIETAYQLKHGTRIKARLILVRSASTAQDALTRIKNGASFAEVAGEVSVDPSSQRGGLIEPVSPADGSYPVAVRRILQDMAPGATSDPIAVNWGNEAGFAIVRHEGELIRAGAPAKDQVAKQLEDEIRLVRERALMERKARNLVRSAGVSVMDPALGWSWERWRTAENP